MTVTPFRTTVTVLPLAVISKWFHSPTGLSARCRGVTAARRSGGVSRRGRPGYISHRPVGPVPGGGGGAGVGGGVAAGPHGVHLARADGPAPDVDLVIAVAAEEDAGVGVGQRELQFFAVDVLRVRAVGQDVRDVLVD